MSDQINETKAVISIINMMRNSSSEQVALFKTSYLKYFTAQEFPPTSIQADKIVFLNRQSAIKYLQNKYNLIPTEELCHLPSKK